jgi:hypothetical protein
MRQFLLGLFLLTYANGNAQLSFYTVDSIPFEPISIDSGATVLQLLDDYYLSVPLGFTFTYFENTYSSVTVGANGIMQFGSAQNMMMFNFNDPLPSPNVPVNAIFLAGIDLEPSQHVVRYKTIGQAPNRIFVVEYIDIPVWSCQNLSSFTGQLQLHEGSNAIEMHVTNFIGCGLNPVWNGYAIQGIQNEWGTLAYIVEGRDLDVYWEANEEAWRFDRGMLDSLQQFTIHGRVWLDMNGNCTVDSMDTPVPNYTVHCTPGNYSTQTDTAGNYSFELFATSLYNINGSVDPILQTLYQIPCPAGGVYSNTFIATNDSTISYDFFIKPNNNCADLKAVVNPIAPVLPCNQAPRIHAIDITNIRLVPSGPYSVKLQLPESIHFMESAPTVNSISGNSFIWQINDTLSYQETYRIYWKDSLSCNTDSLITLCREVSIIESDCNTTNNTVSLCDLQQSTQLSGEASMQVFNVLPIPLYDEKYPIIQNSLEYVFRVHYQNTSNDTIQSIVIRDSLDNFFFPQVFEVISSTNPCSTSRVGSIVEFYFQDLQLPPASENSDASHVSLIFKIGADTPLQPGDTVFNKAQLFIPNQPASFTNDVKIYMPNISGFSMGINKSPAIRLIPNPANQVVIIEGNYTNNNLTLVDLLGRQIRHMNLQGTNPSVDMEGLAKGIYHVVIHLETSIITAPLVVNR